MAKLSSNGYEAVRLIHAGTGQERSYRTNGVILAKDKGGTWKRAESVAHLKGEHRWAFFHYAYTRRVNGGLWNLAGSPCRELRTIVDHPRYQELVEESVEKNKKHALRLNAQEAARREVYEAGREQREREAREVEQFAAVAIEARTAAAAAIVCCSCGGILDQSTTVLAVHKGTGGGVALHGDCYERRLASGHPLTAQADGRTVPAHLWRLSNDGLVSAALIASRQEGIR